MAEMERERDLVLPPNAFAFVSDETKGIIECHVGPTKTSLAKESQPIIYDSKSKAFTKVPLDRAIQLFATAPEGWYLVLKNPSKDQKHPKPSARNEGADLDVGKKINVPGPTSFALWPGQMVKVVQGHHLRSNQYLLVRVYDEEAAKANYKNAVIKTTDSSPVPNKGAKASLELNLTMGALNIIKGTEVSFYIPPTGIEVIPDTNGSYTRDAVTLERLEYSILLDESGDREYPTGPAVVFPKPTQKFIQRVFDKINYVKFRAIELNEQMGIYVKVNADYTDENGKEHKVGDELFITGKDTKIYFPREEHSIVKYGANTIHYAIAIPKGEARYVLDKNTGDIRTITGPAMFLADPRTQVVVRRILTERQVGLWFPGNQEALKFNQTLSATASAGEGFVRNDVTTSGMINNISGGSYRNSAFLAAETRSASEELAMDQMSRKTTFTPPHTITLDTKYDGVVCINVWPGYAVQVVRRTGEREVHIGPKNLLLEYDATLEALNLSTGKPKTTDKTLETTYLMCKHNLVSDIVRVVTKDMVTCNIKLSYRVNFLEEHSKKWFMVSNYVKFLCDHSRSILGSAAKHLTVEQLNADPVAFVRDTILGKVGEKGEARPLRTFTENGMQIYDVEILDITIGDTTIASMLTKAQNESVRQTLELATAQRDLEVTRQLEQIKQAKAQAIAETLKKNEEIQNQTSLVSQARTKACEEFNLAIQEIRNQINDEDLEFQKRSHDEQIRYTREQTQIAVNAFTAKMTAIAPDLVAAITTAGKLNLAERLAENLPKMPQTLFGPMGMQAIAKMAEGTAFEEAMQILNNGANPIVQQHPIQAVK